MADFVPPTQSFTPPPDMLASFIRGQMAPVQLAGAQQQVQQSAAMFPGQLEAQGLQLSQLRLALQNQQTYRQVAMNQLQQNGALGASSSQGGAEAGGASSGGIQNGPQGSVSSQPPSGSVAGWSPTTLSALAVLRGDDPLKTAQGVQDYQQKQRQLQVQGPMDLADSVATSPNADQIIRNNTSLQQQWVQMAPKLGLDPFKDLNPQNARMVARFGYNQLAGSAGLPAKEMPGQTQYIQGPNGQLLAKDAVSGKVSEVVGQKAPGYSVEAGYDVNTGKKNAQLIQTAPAGQQTPIDANGNPTRSAGPRGTGGGVGSVGASGIDLGYQQPSAPEAKAAMFGSEMRSGLQTLQSLESKGFSLAPAQRAAFINAATSEDDGMIKQLFSQEGLVHALSPQGQTYMAALMPLLQAAGHDQSGARLSTAQVRQNLESMIPIDVKNKDALAQVNSNRQGFYTGILTQAGSAVHLPQYANTLASDLKQQQTQAQTAPAAAIQHLQQHPELAAQFKAKYGYLPNGQ